jgi:hypothetical protein
MSAPGRRHGCGEILHGRELAPTRFRAKPINQLGRTAGLEICDQKAGRGSGRENGLMGAGPCY